MNTQNQNQITNLKFLDDSPVPEDKIELHKNIAETIKDIINLTHVNSKNYNRKRIIGLFGSWGSGKSTVVEILRKDKDLGDEKIFIFDSWSHRGDFLKRAFLLELANKLEVKKEKYEIDDKKEKSSTVEEVLTRKIIEKHIDPEIKMGFFTRIISSIILLSIIIVAINKIMDFLIPYVSYSLIAHISDFLVEHKIITWIGIMATFVLFYSFLPPFINFYILKKAKTTEYHTTKEDLEFTNYDYEKYLCYILQKAKENNRLKENDLFVIVFDNLDRVEDETVLNTLSLIQLTNEAINKSGFNNIYFLIPIDKERLEKTVKTIIAKSDSDNTEREKFARDFLEKIFPYKVTIPNINHTNWRKFFTELMKEAFGSSGISDGDILFIRRLFEQAIIESNTNLTPREIKNFINSLVENYLYWKNFKEIPDLKLQALFVVLNNYLAEELKKCIKVIEESQSFEKVGCENSSFEKIIHIAKKEFPEKEIFTSLLKQFYRTDKIYTLFVEQLSNAINNEDIDTINRIVELFEDRNKTIDLVNTLIESRDDYTVDINLLLKLLYSLQESKLKDIYYTCEKFVIASLKSIVTDIEKISKLDISNVNKFKYIMDSNSEIRNLFIDKSVEIITLTSWEGEDEA